MGRPKGWSVTKVSGIKTAHFCHKKLFLATAATKEDAIRLIEETKKGKRLPFKLSKINNIDKQ